MDNLAVFVADALDGWRRWSRIVDLPDARTATRAEIEPGFVAGRHIGFDDVAGVQAVNGFPAREIARWTSAFGKSGAPRPIALTPAMPVLPTQDVSDIAD